VEQVFGYEPHELLGKPIETLLPEQLRSPHKDHRANYYAAPSTRPMGKNLNLSALRRNGREFPAEISLSYLDTEHGLLVMAIVRDITDRRAAEELVQEERRRLQTLIDISPAGIFVVAADGRVLLINHEAERQIGFGLAQEDSLAGYLGAFIYRRLDGSEFGRGELPLERALARGETITGENVILDDRKGKTTPLLVHAAPIYSVHGEIDGAIAVFQDVTQVMEADRLRDSLTRFEERERMQMDLHDAVIGSIYAATLHLEGCLDEPGVVPATRDTLNVTIDRMHKIIEEIRTHILNQGPAAHESGLHDGLRRLLDDLTSTNGVDGALEWPSEPTPLSDAQSSAAFHVVQEALNNILKHAQPSRVVVRLVESRDHVSIEVVDDGTGFDVSADQTRDHHGLRNMAERARGVGGTLSIHSVPKQGTTVILRFPNHSG
jgi:PAS domain S-box-containing protein